jgi:hypothetical protein
MTGTLLLISFHQNIQIYCMKKELRKCLKVIARCRSSQNDDSTFIAKCRPSQIKENAEKTFNQLSQFRAKSIPFQNRENAISQIKKSLKNMEDEF